MWRSTSDAVRPLGERGGGSESEGVHRRVGGCYKGIRHMSCRHPTLAECQYELILGVISIQGHRTHSNAPVGLHLKFDFLCFPSWHAIIVDGHSVEELCKVLSQPRHQPLAIIAKTIKGKGIPGTIIRHTHSDPQYAGFSFILLCVSKGLTCCLFLFIKKRLLLSCS